MPRRQSAGNGEPRHHAKPEAIERMARRLVVELADIVGNRPVRWIMLGSTVGRLNVDWEVAEAAAAFAARKGWVNQQGHSLILLEAGRRMLKTSRRRRRPAKKSPPSDRP